MSESLIQRKCCNWNVTDKIIISHRKSVIRFESTISLLRKLTRDFLCFFIASSRMH